MLNYMSKLGSLYERAKELNLYKKKNNLVSAGVSEGGLESAMSDNILEKAQKGFTLIELLVAIAIIATLAAMLLPALAKARNILTYSNFYW